MSPYCWIYNNKSIREERQNETTWKETLVILPELSYYQTEVEFFFS